MVRLGNEPMSEWRKKYRVHPAADVFPMMRDEELQKLGENIKAHGLAEPIAHKSDGEVLDGRNRLEAMERAGIPFDLFVDHGLSVDHGIDGQEAVEFIISKNIHRRHLTKQQEADLIV